MPLTYEDIRRIELSEKKSAQLCKLPQDFYAESLKYVEELKESLEEMKKNPESSRKVSMLEDQVRNAVDSLRNTYDMRERKIVTLALSAARGAILDISQLSPGEKEAYRHILEVLKSTRDELLSGKKECREKPETRREDVDAKKVAESERKEEYVVVRALEDVPSFVGNDGRKYMLKNGDVASVHPANAAILEKHGKAERIL